MPQPTKAFLLDEIQEAHAVLTELGVAIGNIFGPFTLAQRIRELAETVTPERADMARAARRRMHGEE